MNYIELYNKNLDNNSLVKKQLKDAFVCTFLFLFLAHAARYFNLAFTNDSVQIYQATDAEWQLSIGRWGQVLYCRLRGTIVAPYVIGVLCAIYISCAVFLIVRLFHIEKRIYVVILSMFMTCNEALTSLNATFINYADILMLSMLLSVIAVYFWNNYKYGFLLGALFLTISISLYQADIQTAIVLIISSIIIKIFDGETSREIIIKIIKAAVLFMCSISLYLLSLPIVAEHSKVAISNSYNSPSIIFEDGFFTDSINKICNAWRQPFDFMLHPHMLHPVISTVIFLLLVGWTIVLFFQEIISSNQTLYLKVFAIVLLAVFPFGANVSNYLSGLVRERMTYSYSICLILFISMMSRKICVLKRNTLSYVLNFSIPIIFACTLYYNNFVYGNEYYVRRALEYDTTLSLITRVIDRIEQTPGYSQSTEVAIIGTLYDSPLAMVRPGFEHLGERDDPNTTNVFAPSAPEKYYWYFWQVLGYPLNLVDEARRYKIFVRKDVRTMPVFPEEGCIQFIDDVLVVKLGYVYIPPEYR